MPNIGINEIKTHQFLKKKRVFSHHYMGNAVSLKT